jgi:diacylglycerol kinase (ATP)
VTSPFGPLTAIANPRAGRGRVGAELPALERALNCLGLDHRIVTASGPDEAVSAASDALMDGSRYLVAVGGDGTVAQVINGMFHDGKPIVEDPVLGIVSAHSGCDLARSFGLPDDTDRACDHLTGDNTYRFDVVKVTCVGPDGERITRYAHNLAELGLGGEIAKEQLRMPSRWGNAARFLAFWSAYLATRMREVKVDVDGGSYEGPAYNIVVANGQFTSGGLRLSPRSFPGDGVIDTLIFHGPRSDAYTMLPRMFRHGDHIPDPHIAERRAKIRVAVDADQPLAIVADGNVIGSTPATFMVVPQQILVKL